MTINAGTRLGPYEILSPLGAGGMGEVWRGRDTRLGRDVAIKVLPPGFAQKEQSRARFEREAKTISSLNHPNICTLFDVGHEEGTHFLVMELIEGESLADRIQKGPLPLDQVLRYGSQVADALARAHKQGIVHRDLKPGNVMISKTGAKLLDFGLARLASESTVVHGMTEMPTQAKPLTQEGALLGTFRYMAPEQLDGQEADSRTDIFSLGVLLYEMATGKRAFEGSSRTSLIAAIVSSHPAPISSVAPMSPPALDHIVKKCLEKDPDDRWQSAHDIASELRWLSEAGSQAGVATTVPLRRKTREKLAWGVAALFAVVAAIALGFLLFRGPSAPPGPAPGVDARGPSPVVRSSILLPEGESLSQGNSVALSPDGSVLALSVGLDEKARIYLRRLDTLEMEPIPGTEGARSPFFSPDGEQLGFLADGRLKKVLLRGTARAVTVLCDAPVSLGGTWDSNGWIYFTFGESRLARVREDGGKPQELGKAGDVHHVSALPEGRGILLTLATSEAQSTRKDTSTIAVLSPDGETVKPVLDGGYNARYLSSGHLVFLRGGGLFAVPFDLDRLEASAPAASVQPAVWTDSVWAIARYDVSSDGTLAFVSGGNFARTVPTWIDLETGEEQPLPVPPGVYNTFNLSPDGTQLAIQSASGAEDQVYVHDAGRGTFTRLTDDGANIYPAWSPDGREVFFASSRDGKGYVLYRQPVDGSAPATRLLTDEQEALIETDQRYPMSVTPDGKYLLAMSWAHPTRGGDLWKVPLDGSGGPEAVLATAANEIIPQVSPDGRWLAYLSDQHGDYKIMVRPFPDVQRRVWVVSGDGHTFDPRWSSRGDALLFRSGWGRLMRVSVGGTDEFVPGVVQELMEIDFHDSAGSSFAVSADGKRVLVNKPVGVSYRDRTPVTLVTGWAGEVRRKIEMP